MSRNAREAAFTAQLTALTAQIKRESLLLLQRTGVQFPAPTQPLTAA